MRICRCLGCPVFPQDSLGPEKTGGFQRCAEDQKDSGAKYARRGIKIFVSEDEQSGQPQQGQGGGQNRADSLARMLRQTRPAENASEGAAACKADFRPESSSSNVTFSCSARAGSKERSGAVSPRSHRLTDLSDICRDSANSFCVMPRALRRAAMRPPKRFISIAFLLIFYFPTEWIWFYCKGRGSERPATHAGKSLKNRESFGKYERIVRNGGERLTLSKAWYYHIEVAIYIRGRETKGT